MSLKTVPEKATRTKQVVRTRVEAPAGSLQGVKATVTKRTPSKKKASSTVIPTLSPHVKTPHDATNVVHVPVVSEEATTYTALLAPLHPAVIALVARVAGVFLVVAGGALSLYHLPVMMPETDSLLGQVTESLSTDSSLHGDSFIDATDSETYEDSNSLPVIDADTAGIEFNGQLSVPSGVLRGTVPIMLSGAGAERVDIGTYDLEYGEHHIWGRATRVDNTRWRYNLDTTVLQNGRYELYAVVRTATDEIEVVAPNPSEIMNTTTEPIQLIFSVSVNDDNPLETEAYALRGDPLVFAWVSENAVSCEARTNNFSTGGATEGTFTAVASLTNTPMTYTVRCSNNVEYVSQSIRVYVAEDTTTADEAISTENVIDEYFDTETEAISDDSAATTVEADNLVAPPDDVALEQLLRPTITLRVPMTELLSGIVPLYVSATHARTVELHLVPKLAATPRFIDLATRQPDGSWRASWDTRNTPDGEYAVFARVKTMYGEFTSERASVVVKNGLLPTTARTFDPETTTATASPATTPPSTAPDTHSDTNPAVTTSEQDTEATPEAKDTRQAGLIAARTQDKATQDSDGDGVTDFDEINIYKTDPHSADTDNDGSNDDLEILGGFDPVNSEPEAVVRFESPKESGEVRSDILVVESIVALTPRAPIADATTTPPVAAVITGRALPNSFVTLYIFSEPVVITVRTDDTGAWSYTFDKELADGTHEIYVGITDNAGRVVAKSEPFMFVKQAQAFTPAAAAAELPTPAPQASSFVSYRMHLLVGSIAVVAIGLVLIILGFYLNRQQGVVTKPA